MSPHQIQIKNAHTQGQTHLAVNIVNLFGITNTQSHYLELDEYAFEGGGMPERESGLNLSADQIRKREHMFGCE